MQLTTLSKEEVFNLVNSPAKKESYNFKGHSFSPLKNTGKQYCKGCGLVAGNNDLTVWCIDKGCNYSDHPQYEKTKKKLTRLW